MKSSRREALAAGERHYFTGIPCRHGHVAIRRTGSGTCVVCHRASSARQWVKLRDGPPEILAWHYARQRAYAKGEPAPRRPKSSFPKSHVVPVPDDATANTHRGEDDCGFLLTHPTDV